ncbi:MAG TPA: arginine deiminase [Clostridiaceae bacterium]|nr:arginine deiminase [Clostridiaceae bacterium]
MHSSIPRGGNAEYLFSSIPPGAFAANGGFFVSERSGVQIFSEIGRIKRIMLHRPGRELDNLTPPNMKRLLFDEIPDSYVAEREHDMFADVLRESGAEVVYVADLLSDVLADLSVRDAFLQEFLEEANIYRSQWHDIYNYLYDMEDSNDVASTVIMGLRREDISFNNEHLDLLDRKKTLWFDPIPNLYYTRDAMTVIGKGVSVNCMWTNTRKRETLIMKYITGHHPHFAGATSFYTRDENASLEGGDILVLSPKVVAIGISQRTESAAVKTLATRILHSDMGFERVLAFFIPIKRAFMHLDTVFTMVDHDIFTIHPEIEGFVEMLDIMKDKNGDLVVKNLGGDLEDVLKKTLGLSEIELIRCGGTSVIDSQREQWNDGSNTLAIAPGEVIVYERNRVTNRLLKEAGVILHEIPASELSRGRGGPRCMSMPLWRELLD